MRRREPPQQERAVLGQVLRPPVGESRFWALQAVVLILVVGHFVADLNGPAIWIPAGIPVALLLMPVSYAALRYGLAGSVATAGWATVLWLPDLLLPENRGHPGNDLIELALVFAVAVFVGRHIETEQAERERARQFACLLLDAQEREQRRIAQELHDEPLQRLVGLSRYLDDAAAIPDSSVVAATIAEARAQTLDIASSVREVVRGLRPPALERFGLASALRGLVAAMEGQAGARVDLSVDGETPRMTPDVELGLFRIAQEALNNALRHGRPAHIRVSLCEADGYLHLRVADDGRGFDPRSRAEGRHDGFGLIGMRERAELIGGHLAVRSQRDKGTVVDLVLGSAGRPGSVVAPHGPTRPLDATSAPVSKV